MDTNVTYTIEVEPEHIPVRGNALASGDDAVDREVEDEILARLDRGDEWAWCTVKVTAHYDEFTGVDYLGGCSYKSEIDFRKDAYFQDMCDAALADLKNNLRADIRNGHEAEAILAELDRTR